ncbi:MAG: hypothetical protein AAGA73_17725, partial [Pseudomonadota bacterium]
WFITLVLGNLANGFNQDVGLPTSKDEKIGGTSLAGVDRFSMEHTDWQDSSGFYGDDGSAEIGGESSGLLNFED